jgi:hypothetical protein
MKGWLRALWAETIFAWWALLSAVSTISTFFVASWSGRLRELGFVSGITAFGWANYRVFKRQQNQIGRFERTIAAQDVRASHLRIIAADGSRFILMPVQNIPMADFHGGYFEFFLMIENFGRRNSVVIDYKVEIAELDMICANLKPVENRDLVPGHHTQFGINRSTSLARQVAFKYLPRELLRAALFYSTCLIYLPSSSLLPSSIWVEQIDVLRRLAAD